MKPILNLDDPVRLLREPEALKPLSDNEQMPKGSIHYRIPRGVYRFHSHEEADVWLEKYRVGKD